MMLAILFKFVVWTLVVLLPFVLLGYGAFVLLGLPNRRQERARFFLELIEGELARGKNLEQTIISLSESRDMSLGVRFHLLAAYVESGRRLWEALEKVPGFLPPQITAMLKQGQRLGALQKLLPVARRILDDGRSRQLSAFNYFIIVALALTPAVPVLFILLNIFVLPKFRDVFAAVSGGAVLPLTSGVIHLGIWFAVAQIAIALVLYVATILYVGGPRLVSLLKTPLGSMPDRMALMFPWKRQRVLQVFSTTLASLLDNGVPEGQAVEIAADVTANDVIIARSKTAVRRLSQGERLTDVMAVFDSDGQFKWRLANASMNRNGFTTALSGWIEALEARAFEQEQAASQLITTGLVLLNGFMVGSVIIGLFSPLIAIVNQAALW